MKFRGKVAVWFYIIMLVVALVELPLIFASLFAKPNITVFICAATIFVLIETFCSLIVCRNFVKLGVESLDIVFGIIRKQIKYSEIRSVEPVHDLSSSLAASVDRIRIMYSDDKEVMISIYDKDKFLSEISLHYREG